MYFMLCFILVILLLKVSNTINGGPMWHLNIDMVLYLAPDIDFLNSFRTFLSFTYIF